MIYDGGKGGGGLADGSPPFLHRLMWIETPVRMAPAWAFPSCYAEPARGGGRGEALDHVGQRRLEGLAVQPG